MYKTNKYDLPFVQIVGVTSTNKTFSIAFFFIINEKEENYNWALTCLKLTLEECMYQRVIVTDRELALMNACQQVFPDATRLLCRWHITENIKKHCRQSIKLQHDWDSFRAMWNVLVESPTWILGECIPLDSIDVFWRKLDLSPSTSVENEDICCDGELEMFKENFTKQSKAGKKSLLRKLRDIFQPSKTLIKEPTIQKNTHGRPTLKKQQQKRVDSISQAPRRRSHSTTSKSVGLDLVELNKEPAKHSSYVIEIPDLNPEPSEQVSDFIDLSQMPKSCDTHPLMKEILDMFHPYITHVQDIKGDGNCGFEAISVCLGYGEDQWLYVRHQLLDELLSSYDVYARVFIDGIDELRNSLCFSQSPAPAEHWMVMLMTGVLIANKFGVVLNYLTKRGDITFFPLWRGPEHF
ncbi:uncharacterized protein [Gossypium hirsutum]|uniref:MULE transposase domain-containing protein n=1 Tax=Gossypium hirsutum TaxID=3635 RepID=A0A1U8JVK0_GOSHI|nr:uncharacterized protein LOC107910899 [Gossypium hirsutum]